MKGLEKCVGKLEGEGFKGKCKGKKGGWEARMVWVSEVESKGK